MLVLRVCRKPGTSDHFGPIRGIPYQEYPAGDDVSSEEAPAWPRCGRISSTNSRHVIPTVKRLSGTAAFKTRTLLRREFEQIAKDFPNFKFNSLVRAQTGRQLERLYRVHPPGDHGQLPEQHEEPEEIEYYICGPP